MILRKISWIAVLFTLVMTLSSNISLAENEGTECENKFCIPPINKGNQGFFSRVINRIDGTPPNTEHLKSSANMGQPFSISIDGNPTSNNANVTRKKDIALSKGDIQVRFDGLKLQSVVKPLHSHHTPTLQLLLLKQNYVFLQKMNPFKKHL
jgi:hypothetical protein